MKTVYYNVTTGKLFDIERGRTAASSTFPWIRYREKDRLVINLITGITAAGSPIIYTGLDASLIYEAAIDKDHKISTTLMCRTLNEEITVNQAAGTIAVELNANTTEFKYAVDGKKMITTTTFELHGSNAGGLVWSLDFDFYCKGTINISDHMPETISGDDYYSKSEIDQIIENSATTGGIEVDTFGDLPVDPTPGMSAVVASLEFPLFWSEVRNEWINAMGVPYTAADES